MKKLILFFSAIFISVFTASTYAQEVIELKQSESNKVVIKLMFRNGSIVDPSGKDGLTYTTANTVIRGGTKNKTSKQIQELIYPMAVDYQVLVDKEVTVFTFQIHNDFLEQFYPVLRDLILSPAFAEEDFDRVKSNQENYVDQLIRASSDEEYSKMALEDNLFRGTNYQHMVMGNTPGVDSITLDDVKQHYKKYFTTHNLSIGIAGKYSPAFLERLKTDMSKL
ncbi:MAG: insulinase family protein, partial [Bacteroidia bacterium]|nr:insulinase family protein [Bacteroidia bacterium]